MLKILKTTAKVIIFTILTAIGLFLTLVLVFNSIRWHDISWQKRHLADLAELYDGTYVPVDEQQFVAFDLATTTLRLNEIRMIASHNSYKKLGTGLGKLFVGLGDSFAEAEALKYGNPDLTAQLDLGIRSFELDVRYRRGDFECTHVPLVDNSTTAAKLALALEEIKLWSDGNPGHIPIILLFELKDDWMILDPMLANIGAIELLLLDELLKDKFEDSLYTPGMLMDGHDSPNARLQAESWPLLTELLGKIIVVLHPGSFTQTYLETDPDYDSMAMFPGVSNLNVDHPYATFVVHNDPNVENIAALLDANLIVRTRMDANLVVDPDTRARAMASGAQLMTTDFHPAHQLEEGEAVYLQDEFLIITNDVLTADE